MRQVDVTWSRNLFDSMKDGGTWAVPRSGMIFQRHGNELVLMTAMPHMAEMPITPKQLTEQQDGEFKSIKAHFEAAGIPVRRQEEPA